MPDAAEKGLLAGTSEEALQTLAAAVARVGQCRSLQDFADLAPELLGNPLVVLDTRNSVLACTGQGCSDAVLETLRRGALPPEGAAAEEWQQSGTRGWNYPGVQELEYGTEADRVNCLSLVLRTDTRILGRAVIPLLLRQKQPGDALAMELLGSRLALWMAERRIGTERPATETGMCICRLLDGAPVSAAQRNAAAAQLRGNLCLLCVNAAELDDARRRVLEHLGGELVHYGGYAVVVLAERGNDFGREWRSELQKQLRPLGLHCGTSTPFTGLDRLHGAYMEARAALSIGSRMHLEEMVWSYEELCFYDLFRSAAGEQDSLLRFLSPGMHRLIRADEEQHLELLKTLRCYLLNARSLQATAAALHIHRNTVTHRISRAFEIMGSSAENGRDIMRLAAELQLMEYTDRRRFFEDMEGML